MSLLVRHLILILGIVLFVPTTYATAGGSGVLQHKAFKHQGVEREYYVHYPNNRLPATPRPLVFVLHGGGGATADTMASRTDMNNMTDRENFIVVYPAGAYGQWNDGRGKSFRRDKDTTGVDDVGFFSAIINSLIASHSCFIGYRMAGTTCPAATPRTAPACWAKSAWTSTARKPSGRFSKSIHCRARCWQ